jgi:hypothetical protein
MQAGIGVPSSGEEVVISNPFGIPNMDDEFEHYFHSGGCFRDAPKGLIELQRGMIEDGFSVCESERRNHFVHLGADVDGDLERDLKGVLINACDEVVSMVNGLVGSCFDLDEKLSAVWVENGFSKSNLKLHRDSDDRSVVRATFSVTPTRLVRAGVLLPIDDAAWARRHYPMSADVLSDQGVPTINGVCGGISLMSGLTYHRSPSTNEIRDDFDSIFCDDIIANVKGRIPRVFGSIWGQLR